MQNISTVVKLALLLSFFALASAAPLDVETERQPNNVRTRSYILRLFPNGLTVKQNMQHHDLINGIVAPDVISKRDSEVS